MTIQQRKIQLMKEKRQHPSNDVIQRLNIITMLDAKIKSLVKEEQLTEDQALLKAVLKVEKDLIKEKESIVASKRQDKLEDINIQFDELLKYKPQMMTQEEINQYINQREDLNQLQFKDAMSILKVELKDKAEMKDIVAVLKSK